MRSHLSLLAAALTVAAFGLPGSAQAADLPDAAVPCADQAAATIDCSDKAPATTVICPGRDLVPASANLAAVRTATICLVNEERTKRGLRELRSASPLQRAAHGYSNRMVREKFFEHTAPDGSTFLSRIKRTSYLRGALRRWSVGENIAWGTGELATPERIVDAWMHSPGHRRNILTANFNELGVGVATGAPVAGRSGRGATYVNEFGERRR